MTKKHKDEDPLPKPVMGTGTGHDGEVVDVEVPADETTASGKKGES